MAVAADRVSQSEHERVASRANPPHAPRPAVASLRRGSLILVEEDHEVDQKVIRQQLSMLGYRIEFAGHGREPLVRWRLGDYALRLTHLHMLGMDGDELTAAIPRAEAEVGGERLPNIGDCRRSAQQLAHDHCSALSVGDGPGAASGAHKPKSLSLSVAARALGGVCARPEAAGHGADAAVMAPLAREFDLALGEVFSAIQHRGGVHGLA